MLEYAQALILEAIEPARLTVLPFMDVHLALYLLWLLPEVLPSAGKGTDPLPALFPLMAAVVASDAPAYPHSAVTLQFFELCFRFSRFFVDNPEAIGRVLAFFLGPSGLRNPKSSVRA